MELFKSRARVVYTNAVGDKVYPVVVDIKKGIKSTEEVTFVSSDINTGILSVAFVQGNEIYNVSGAEVVCSVMRPDASTLEIPCEVVSGNIVEVPLGVNGTSQDGVYSMDFKIFKGGNKVVGTPIMNYSVSLSIGNDMVVEEDDRLPILTMLMTQVGTLKEEVTSVISQANDTIELARVATNNAVDATNNANSTIERVSQEVVEVIEEVEARANNTITTMVNTANEKVVEMDTAKIDMTNTVSNKINEVETRFNTLTSKQQQDAEVVDARDNEVSLKARLDRDIEKAKEIYVGVEGTNISTDSSVGYAKDVEILGNTIQSASNLADIRSVGDKIEGQELYEIPVVSYGKNVWNVPISLFNSDKYIQTDNYSRKSGINLPQNSSWTLTFEKKPSDARLYIWKGDVLSRTIGFGNTSLNQTFTLVDNEDGISFYAGNFGSSPYDIMTVDFKIQLEEGTVATPYEPYQEDKLTILSPVQLEKVGDVADRIICKDGVWGVEKNVTDIIPLREYNWTLDENNTRIACYNLSLPVAPSTTQFCNKFSIYDRYAQQKNSFGVNTGYIRFYNDFGFTTTNEVKDWVEKENIMIKVATTQPQFIPLPHDQQVKLRTFASKTNISFLTEIEGTIKAQVPKSIGATVNTHTEQINNLNKELDRVKKLEESTVSTVTTESDFTTVEETSNGYFEDVKLEGNTLVNRTNIFDKVNPSGSGIHRKTSNSLIVDYNKCGELDKAYSLDETEVFKSGQTYTVVIDIIQNTLNQKVEFYPMIWDFATIISGTQYVNVGEIGRKVLVLQANKNYPLKLAYASPNQATQGVTGLVEFKDIMVLDGDYTNKELPSFFEGLMSVGEDAEEVSVESVDGNGNLWDGTYEIGSISTSNGMDASNGTNRKRSFYIPICETKYYAKVLDYVNTDSQVFVHCYDKNKNPIKWNYGDYVMGVHNYTITLTIPTGGRYLKFRTEDNRVLTPNSVLITKSDIIKGDTPHQSDKKRLLYYNNETQTWEKPILRQWDSIEKHSDGKYYYHKRSGEVVLNGSESWGWTHVPSSDSTNVMSFNTRLEINSDTQKHTSICNNFSNIGSFGVEADFENFFHANPSYIQFRILKSKLSTQDVNGFKQWLQANNVTVVYQLAQEEVYECTNIDLITYSGETNYIVSCGAIAPKSTLKVHNNISNVVKILQEKVSVLESNVKASQEMQDMMILESDMRILELEMALMPMNIELNIGGNPMLRSATYYNFIKRHIESETYSKEYLENVMNKYLATNRLTEAEYDELYKILYPPVYDIELPIEL